jgi:hypothetical protein
MQNDECRTQNEIRMPSSPFLILPSALIILHFLLRFRRWIGAGCD